MDMVIAFALGALVGMVACAAWVQWMIGALGERYSGTRQRPGRGAALRLGLPNFRAPPALMKWLSLVTWGIAGQNPKGYWHTAVRPKKRLRK